MKQLFNYQKEIVNSQYNPSSALFMDMGTGKTVTSLALFRKSKQPKLLVICILSKLEDWKEDIKTECGLSSVILNKGSKKNTEILSSGGSSAYIINFESAWRLKELLNWVDKDTYIIIDESHKIKSVSSNIGKFCNRLKIKTNTKCILTGTPQSRGYIDYYNQLSFVDLLWIPYKSFVDKYCVFEIQRYGAAPFKQLVGYKNTEALDDLIKTNCVFFKRKIDEKDIPTDIDVKFKKPLKYELFKRIRVYEDYAADNISKLFVTLRKMSSGYIDKYKITNPKIKWLEEFIEELGCRVVIFYNFNCERDDIIELLDKLNIPYSQYNGDYKDLSNFRNNQNGVAVCQYMSASLGINDLVASNLCVLYSPTTNYTNYAQSKKRIDRIGQTKKPLFYNLYCQGTVEEKILETIKKGKNFDEKMFEGYMKGGD